MAVGEAVNGCTGTGTAADPYIPENFLGFRNAVGVSGAYVCIMNDIDVSKDAVYKTGITSAIAVNAAYIYGTAMTFSNTKTYNIGDVCTYNDGEHGLCMYTCREDGTVGVDVTDTDYWTRGDNDPTKKLTGLMVTATNFFYLVDATARVYFENIFFESCVFDCTSLNSSNAGFIRYGVGVSVYDCKFSIFFNQHASWSAHFVTSGTQTNTASFLRCSIYVRYTNSTISGTAEGKFSTNYTTFTNCTTSIIGMRFVAANSQTSSFGKYVRSSIVMNDIDIYKSSGGSTFPIPYATNSFISISFRSISGTTPTTFTMTKTTLSGVNVFDKEAAQAITGCTVTITSDGNLIQGTTAQCKDKDWLISKGFFTS